MACIFNPNQSRFARNKIIKPHCVPPSFPVQINCPVKGVSIQQNDRFCNEMEDIIEKTLPMWGSVDKIL